MNKKITILHANDIHGRLNFTVGKDLTVQGGISLLSGYVKKVRAETPVFFGICGDVLQEDVWGSDYKGTNTVELINYLKPDAISLGNHEMDYGLEHLLIFNSCIRSSVLCANIMVAPLVQVLFKPGKVYEVNGVRILMIGVIPQAFLNKILSDEFCRNMLSYKDSYMAIREEITAHASEDIDLVVLMSHYGIEGDRELAANMPEDIHVDLILGGHTHIDMDEAEVVNGIPIAQSSYGTTHIGRFDLVVDTERKRITEWSWERVALTEELCDYDYGVDELADRIVFDKKKIVSNDTICRLASVFTHKSRLYETEIGDLVADAFLNIYPVDLVILQSGSIRRKEVGPEVTEKDFKELYPFDDRFVSVTMSGEEIKDCFAYLFSLKEDGSVMNGTFQYSRGFRLVVDGAGCWERGCRVEEITLNGEPLQDYKLYRVGMTKNCADSTFRYFNYVFGEERRRLLSFSTYSDLASWLMRQEGEIPMPEKGRFELRDFPGMK